MRVTLLSLLAKFLRIQFHIDGFPFGATMRRPKGVDGVIDCSS